MVDIRLESKRGTEVDVRLGRQQSAEMKEVLHCLVSGQQSPMFCVSWVLNILGRGLPSCFDTESVFYVFSDVFQSRNLLQQSGVILISSNHFFLQLLPVAEDGRGIVASHQNCEFRLLLSCPPSSLND